MTKEEFRQFQEDFFESVRNLTDSKGEEYSNSADQFANFKRNAEGLGITPQQAWGVLFRKHIDAIQHHIATGATLSEPIRGRCLDAALYLILYAGMDHEKRASVQTPAVPAADDS